MAYDPGNQYQAVTLMAYVIEEVWDVNVGAEVRMSLLRLLWFYVDDNPGFPHASHLAEESFVHYVVKELANPRVTPRSKTNMLVTIVEAGNAWEVAKASGWRRTNKRAIQIPRSLDVLAAAAAQR